MKHKSKWLAALLFAGILLGAAILPRGRATAQSRSAESFSSRIHKIMARPEFRHASFGIEIYSLDKGKTLFAHAGDKLFTPASTTKLLTEGTVLESLGADYRFHTRVYRSGDVDSSGTLKGDLILVASGDPNLSSRVQPDGTLAFRDHDHAYGGSPKTQAVPGDPLQVIRELARQVRAHGIKRVEGRVLVDTSLFPDAEAELGTGVIVSSISVNDNVIDITVGPGPSEGAPATISVAPAIPLTEIVNQVVTGARDSKPAMVAPVTAVASNGKQTLTISGRFPLGGQPILYAYPVPQPSKFAELVIAQALQEAGVVVNAPSNSAAPAFKALAKSYTDLNVVAEHVSPPLSEEIKVTLKVSQNLHASMGPYLLGALVAHKTENIDQAGFDVEHEFLQKAGLDLSGASQGDGAGGAQSAFYTPDFMVHYLAYMAKQRDFPVFLKALPVLGRDGTLAEIQPDSPAAGHVFAKTGTFGAYDALNKKLMLTGKGLAGYLTTTSGEHMAFAAYVNRVQLSLEDDDAAQKVAGQALGEIAAAAYDAPIESGESFDILIKNGHIIDGSGNPWFAADIGIRGDRIVAIGDLKDSTASRVIDATGKVVAPGFIDMLGQSEVSLLLDNRSLSKLSQGITSEITGEGGSIAPQNEKTIGPQKPFLDHFHLTVDWTTLDGYFQRLEKQGTPLNIGTYVGAAQIREAVIGDDNRVPTAAELEEMKTLVEQAMQDGALGISTALIYPPGHYAKTEELIELGKVASKYGGLYASHMRSEGASEPAAIDEAIRIGREAHLPVEIFHMKVSGKPRWGYMKTYQEKIKAARDSGLDIAGDMYPYVAGATALASSLPPWIADGGLQKLLERLKDAKIRARVKLELAADHRDWENLYLDCGGASGVMISSVLNPKLKQFEGKRVSEVAAAWKKTPLDTLFDFIEEDQGQTGALYFMASESDLQEGLRQPWTSIGLDANEMSLDGPVFEPHTHPRAFGSMPRFLGHYVRDLHLMPLEQAIRKITSLPAQREHLADRGLLRTGYFADVTIFDPVTIIDKATYTNPAQLSEGVSTVVVNGQVEFENGKLTGAMAGRPLRGRGWRGGQK